MSRKDFHSELEKLNRDKSLGLKKIYYQPPSNIKLDYPCLIYSDLPKTIRYANNHSYIDYDHYQVTIISKNPSDLYKKVLVNSLPFTKDSNTFINDNLYHYIFDCYHIS